MTIQTSEISQRAVLVMSATSAGSSHAWWRQEETLARYVSDLLVGELARLRAGRFVWPEPLPLPDSLPIDERGLGADSLERIQLAASLAGALDLSEGWPGVRALEQGRIGDWLVACRLALAGGGEALRFRSSGSLGAGTLSRHPLGSLLEEVEHLAALVPGRRRVLSCVSAYHVYGFLFSILLPWRLGCPLVMDIRDRSPAGLATLCGAGDLIIGHPVFWAAVAEVCTDLPADLVGVTSTAPCPAEVAIALSARGLRLIDIFGASETAGLGWRDDPDRPYRLFPHWRWASDTADSTALERTMAGETRRFVPPDLLERVSERGFLPLGRCDAAVQVGGVNVSPAAVRERLCGHPWVKDAAVRLMRPSEGARLKAFIVPSADAPGEPDRLEAELRAWIDARLAPPERPRALRFGAAIPAGPTGKPLDWDVCPR